MPPLSIARPGVPPDDFTRRRPMDSSVAAPAAIWQFTREGLAVPVTTSPPDLERPVGALTIGWPASRESISLGVPPVIVIATAPLVALPVVEILSLPKN